MIPPKTARAADLDQLLFPYESTLKSANQPTSKQGKGKDQDHIALKSSRIPSVAFYAFVFAFIWLALSQA
jgi:hypothetical protein